MAEGFEKLKKKGGGINNSELNESAVLLWSRKLFKDTGL